VPEFNWDQRWQYYKYRTYSPERMMMLALDTSFDHAMSSDQDRSLRSFPEHYGAAFARRIARTSVEFGLGGLLKEDIRRRPSNKQGFANRAVWALTHSWMATGPNGNWRPAYSRYAATLAGFAVGASIREQPITTGRVASAYATSLLFNMQDSVLSEFQPDIQRIGFGMARRCFRAVGLKR